ncbi:hypothetical protein ACJRO7_024077 [Eucalyptus globulus]|uniref:THO complex subunit 5B n=1 Tax=Eucalyptus globulus TaxID=34317 RepID=A0ABD3K4A2_EUCGL
MDDEIEEGMLVDEDVRSPEQQQQRLQQQQQPPPQERKAEKSPHDMLRESKGSVEEIAAQILSIKKQGLPRSQLRELATQMFLHFVTLRQANRSILLEEDRVKAETERAKAPVDFTTLQLHNLMYEKSHYVKAIKACRDFKSKYPDIELVPEEEFFRDAPEEIKDSGSHNDAHDLMLKRLNFELFQRKELCKLHEELEKHKKGLLETIANRKKFLSSLPSHLKSLKKASLPVQNQLGVLHSKKLKQHHSAELLPPPLFVIYSQLVAQKEAFEERIDVEIVGSVKDAQSFARQLANKDSGISANSDSSRLDDDVVDEDDDGQRRRKRPKKVPVKENLEQTGFYQVHPLKVILHVYEDEASDQKSSKLMALKFEYMLKLKIICVGIEGSNDRPEDNILCNLFPNDTGLELPHQSAKLAVGDALNFDEARTSRPYKWAQHLAGIDFLPEVSPLLAGHENANGDISKSEVVASGLSLYRQQNRVQTVLQRIRSRKKAQMALVEQLDALAKLKWPALNYKSVPWASHFLSCNLHGWSSIGSVSREPSTLPVVDVEQASEPMDANPDGSSGKEKNELEAPSEDGELPSFGVAASVAIDSRTPFRGSSRENSRQLAMISKGISPINRAKSLSFKKQDEDLDLLLDTDSDKDEPSKFEPEAENAASTECDKVAENSWVNYGVREFILHLTKKLNADGQNVKLEAKIKVSMEYPLRPPLFSLSLYPDLSGGNHCKIDDVGWTNELRAMEAEVNLHMVKMLPLVHENYILAHQVHCLAMLFDYYMDGISLSAEKRESTSIVDVGLCKPVSGMLLSRSFRGRDHRKIISWKSTK